MSQVPVHGVRLGYRSAARRLLARIAEITDEYVDLWFAETAPLAVTARQDGARRRVLGVVTAEESGQRCRLTFPRPSAAFPNHDYAWRLKATVDGQPRTVELGDVADLSVVSPPHRLLRVQLDPGGRPILWQSAWAGVVDDAQLSDRQLILRGALCVPSGQPVNVVLRGGGHTISADLVRDPATNTFTARIDLTGSNAPSKRFGYTARIVGSTGGVEKQRWLRLSPDLESRFPLELEGRLLAAFCTRTGGIGGFWVRFRSVYAADERGKLAQQRLHAAYRAAAAGPLRDIVLFESYGGRSATDSPRALFEELRHQALGLELFWSVDDLSRPAPDGATPVLLHTREWLEIARSARYLVNNSNFPWYFRKQPGQIYVQTWHGTPLKRIGGNDVPPREPVPAVPAQR